MSILLPFYGTFVLIFHSIIAKVPYNCIHEKVSNEDVPIGTLPYESLRGKRHSPSESLQPLIIHTRVDDIDPSLPGNVLFNIDVALRKVEKYITQTLSVSKTFNPFHLERLNCAKRWKTGSNKGKCSQAKSGPEFCSLKLTEIVIPDRYLSKLEIFDNENDQPVSVTKEGEGVRDASFILFVISRSTSWCKENGVQAYGSYCRLDSHNRPVSGIINMCPEYFSKKLYKPSHYYNVIMHEILHILGFSLHLYPKFKICNSEYDCEVPKKIMITDSHGIRRLVFPYIIENMQAHFNCSRDDFGGPLEEYTKNDNVSDDKKYTSHWHPLLMYTSIMTPSILEEDYVVVDNITLSLLSSTGWYKVNFTSAQTFVFGKGGGCNFGFENTCETSSHLCNSSNNARSCDVLHYTIGKCESIVPSHPCGVYRPDLDESCVDERNQITGTKLRFLYHEHRCIMLQNLNDTTVPTCMLVKCGKSKGLEIFTNSTWVPCLNSEKVQVNNMTISCPNIDLDCASNYLHSKNLHSSFKGALALSIRIYFTDPSFNDLIQHGDFRHFKGSILQAIADSLSIPVNYIANASMVLFKELSLEFSIRPPKNISYEELSSIIQNTQAFLKRASFAYIFYGSKDLPVASTKYIIDPDIAVNFSDHEGFRMLIIVPVVCAVFVIATFITFIFRLVRIQMRRPKRETIEMEETSQTSKNDSRISSRPYNG